MTRVLDPQRFAAREWARAGADPNDAAISELITRGLPPMRGGAVGTGPAASYVNGPSPGFAVDPAGFNDRTVENVFSTSLQAFPGFGGRFAGFDLPKRGLIYQIEAVITGTLAVALNAGTVTATDAWNAAGLLSNLTIAVDGTPLISCHGNALLAREQVFFKNSPHPQTNQPSGSLSTQSYTIEQHWVLPIALDLDSLMGTIFGQSDSLYARLEAQVETVANLFTTTGSPTIAFNNGNLQLVVYTYDIPFVDAGGHRVGLLPSMDVVHRIIEYAVAAPTAGGDTALLLPEVPGQIQNIYCWLDNTAGSYLDPASWNSLRFQYAETEVPQNYNPITGLLARNARRYNGRVGSLVANNNKVLVMPFAHSQQRNALYAENVTRPQLIANFPALNSGATFRAAVEWLEGVV